MNTNEHAHAPRPKFDTLFADPRHYRGDCRLMVTAIRRGWLKKAPQADRDALSARFNEAMRERWATEPAGRALFAEAAAMLALDRDIMAPIHRALQYAWAGELTDRATGRPRERWYTTDYPNRIDANELRRRWIAEGTDLRTLQGGAIEVRLEVRPTGKPDDPAWRGERIALAVVEDARYGWRVWLVCPRCQCRRGHLYPVRAGVRCRKCAGIAYADGE